MPLLTRTAARPAATEAARGQLPVRVEEVEDALLAAVVGRAAAAAPVRAVLVERAAVVVVGAVRPAFDGRGIGAVRQLPIELSQSSDIGALERGPVARATVVLAGFAQYAAGLQPDRGGVGQRAGGGQQAGVTCRPVQLGQRGQDDALVVGPGGLAVVGTGVVEAVADHPVGVDHAAVPEPVPAALRPFQVCGVAGGAVVQGRVELDEQLVGDGVLVVPVRAPPDSAAAGAVPVRVHVVRVDSRGVEVAAVAREVVGIDPEQAPPPGVVEVLVPELAALRVDVPGVGVGERVGVAAHPADPDVVGERGQRVGAGPPAVTAEEFAVPVVRHHQRGGGRRAPAVRVPGGPGPGSARDTAARRLPAGAQRSDPLGVPVVDVVHLGAPALPAGRHGRVAQAAAGRPGAAAVHGPVQPYPVARTAVGDGSPAHPVGVVEVQRDGPRGDSGGDGDAVTGAQCRVPGVAVLVAHLRGRCHRGGRHPGREEADGQHRQGHEKCGGRSSGRLHR